MDWTQGAKGNCCSRKQVVNLLSGSVRTATADAALCDAAIAAAATQLPAMELQHLSTLLFSLGKVHCWSDITGMCFLLRVRSDDGYRGG
jgi:hypothetical protein